MKNILIVDDALVNRVLIKKILCRSLEDVSIIEAEDGSKAMDIIKENDISVVVLDINMPGKGGIEVLEEIKSSSKYKYIPVIMCSSLSEIESIEKALSLGAMDYFTKPLTEEQIGILLPLKIKNALKYYENNIQLNKYYHKIKEEMKLAEELQKSIIPKDYSELHGVKVWGRYIPSEEIGGDFYSYKQVKDKIWFIIADISGHGISAAMISMILNLAFITSIEKFKTPSRVLESINTTLYQVFRGSSQGIVSAFIGCIDEGTIYYSNAGHPYPVIYRRSKNSVEEIQFNGLLLGVLEKYNYKTSNSSLDIGDIIILYTDGIFENRKDNSTFDWYFVKEFSKSNRELLSQNSSGFLDKIITFAEEDNEIRFNDDVAIMAIKRISKSNR